MMMLQTIIKNKNKESKENKKEKGEKERIQSKENK
jgi:hypothetical protein